MKAFVNDFVIVSYIYLERERVISNLNALMVVHVMDDHLYATRQK